jgi:hypothetical protein
MSNRKPIHVVRDYKFISKVLGIHITSSAVCSHNALGATEQTFRQCRTCSPKLHEYALHLDLSNFIGSHICALIKTH